MERLQTPSIPNEVLNQGCLLSPYLFILRTDVYSNLIRKAVEQKRIHGVGFNRNTFAISHLLFADDSLIFSQATTEDCSYLKSIFDLYTATSGQRFNMDKSSMFFSPNVPQHTINEIKYLFNLQVVSLHERYLGLPSMVG